MESYLPENEYKEFEGRVYANPQISLDQSNAFIDNLRATQARQNQQIEQQTQNLGTNVPSNLGGLTGAGSYFTSRYQTPQTSSAVANLRATAQAAALNQALQNEQEIWKKRYNDAYRAYQKSVYDKANTPTTEGGIDYNDNTNAVDSEWAYAPSTPYPSVLEPDGNGGTTGREIIVMPDGSNKIVDYNVNYNAGNIERAAGADQFSDVFTGMYNYTLPGGFEVEEGGWDENVRKGSDGNYYMWRKSDNSYTPMVIWDETQGKYVSANGGNSGTTPGGGRWWKK